MSNRPTAAYGLAQMLASDPEMATRIKAWMDANPDAMDRRKQRKLLRDLEAAEALLRAEGSGRSGPGPTGNTEQATSSQLSSSTPDAGHHTPGRVGPGPNLRGFDAATEVGTGFRGAEQKVPFDGNEAINDETACDAETDGTLEPPREIMFGPLEARTYRATGVIKPMHRHAWVLRCAVMAWFETASHFAAMAVIGLAIALILLAHFVAFVAERNREAASANVDSARRGLGPMHGDAWALCNSRAGVAWQLIMPVAAFARGPPTNAPAADVILQTGPGSVTPANARKLQGASWADL